MRCWYSAEKWRLANILLILGIYSNGRAFFSSLMIPKDIEEKLDPLPFHAWGITVSAPIPNPIKRATGLVVLYFIILLGDMVVLDMVEVIYYFNRFYQLLPIWIIFIFVLGTLVNIFTIMIVIIYFLSKSIELYYWHIFIC